MKIFYILSIILLTTFQSKSQTNRPVSQQDPVARVTKFYPNPAVSQITFDFDQNLDKNCTFQVFDFIGKKVLDMGNISQRTVVSVTDFYRGTYIFQLKDKTGKIIETGKFQVSH